jgi:cathepsin L
MFIKILLIQSLINRAFASTATLESHVALSTGLLFDLSVQQFTSCAPNPDSCGGTGGCGGSTAELAYDYLAGDSGIQQVQL